MRLPGRRPGRRWSSDGSLMVPSGVRCGRWGPFRPASASVGSSSARLSNPVHKGWSRCVSGRLVGGVATAATVGVPAPSGIDGRGIDGCSRIHRFRPGEPSRSAVAGGCWPAELQRTAVAADRASSAALLACYQFPAWSAASRFRGGTTHRRSCARAWWAYKRTGRHSGLVGRGVGLEGVSGDLGPPGGALSGGSRRR